MYSVLMVAAVAASVMEVRNVKLSQCGWGCGTDSDCADNPTCPECIYGKCTASHTCPTIPCNDSRACPMGEGRGYCSRCIIGGTPPPPPTPAPPTPPPAPCMPCSGAGPCCNPNAMPAQRCPGNIACCDCGTDACECPKAAFEAAPLNQLLGASKGICGLGLPCGSPCVLDGDCDQTGSCRACGGTGQCVHSN